MPLLRQQVLGVAIDPRRKPDAIFSALVASGNADFFSASSLTLTLECSTTDPFIYDIHGTGYELQADVTLSVTNTAHNFIYIDDTAAMGRSALPCVYEFTAPGSPGSDQHWYDLGESQMKRYNGSAWENVSRIFIGYVRADGGAINARYACEPIGISPLDRWNFYGNGSDGFLDVSSGTTTVDDFKQYTAVVVRGGTLNHSAASSGITTIQSQSIFFVISAGTVNLDALGATGGAGATGAGATGGSGGEGGRGGGGGGGTSAGGTGGAGVVNTRFVASGGGTAGTAAGGSGGNGVAAISSPGPGRNSFFTYPQGAPGGGGGGSGAAAGGNGGAAAGGMEIKAPTFALGTSASMTAVGANGTNGPGVNRGAGGAGGGGTYTIWSRNIFNSGTINVAGGGGGASGGAGSGAGGNGGSGRTSLFQI